MAKQRVVADLFRDWATSYIIHTWTHCVEKTREFLWCGILILLKMDQHPTPTNSNRYYGHSVSPLKDSRVVTVISINIDTMGTMVDSRVVAVTCQISGDDVGPVGVDANNQLYPLASL